MRNGFISIHAARVGCDKDKIKNGTSRKDFNPRSPSGLRLKIGSLKALRMVISIHAARVGCDIFILCIRKRKRYFNPRSPSGLRLFNLLQFDTIGVISIHAARVGCDSIRINCNYYSFYSYKSAKLTFLLN